MKILAILILTLASNPTLACSCVPSSDEQEFEAASAVLLVIITETKYVPGIDDLEWDAVYAEFKIIEIFKGNPAKLKYLRSMKSTCERPLLSGQHYLIYWRGLEYEDISICDFSRGVDLRRDKALLEEYASRK